MGKGTFITKRKTDNPRRTTITMESYYFTEEHKLFRQGLRDFLDREVMPHIDEWEEQERVPKEIWRKFGEMGYLGLIYPEEYGGIEADFFFSVVFIEEISKCFSGGFAITPSVHQYMSNTYIYKHGSETLKQKYLPSAVNGEKIACIGITEPGAGSDVANIQTKAVKDGDYYIVNGAKTFISNAYYGDYVIAVVKTDPEAGVGGISLLVIDLDAEGISKRKLKKLGWHASDTAELNFDDVKVPVENLIGVEGEGFYYLMGGLQLERLVGAIGAVASAEHALSYALDYMNQREAFGRKINRFQVLRHRVAELSSELTAQKYFTYHCCRLQNDNHYAVKECSMAKLNTSELNYKVMYECLQFFGGYGYIEDFKIARLLRDSRILTIGGGSSEVMKEILAKMIIDDKVYQEADGIHFPSQKINETELEKEIVTENLTEMSIEKTTQVLQEKASNAAPLGNSMKFVFGDEGNIYLDGYADNTVSNEDKEADCIVNVTREDFDALLSGELNPMNAFMAGKLKISGDMSVAMKLNTIMG
ncbi:acyl-CoA dehydrogenase family protein [Sediminitomix flava]|uniref:Alkylation response protein AidB-like acyl-CoA dehydrogenase n=1 Tax=Sediminitomix flava TaxID=379075 RepID=A0A315ZF27_SEDFL|nr:acyl-CoA dehydrogenase family protein [Sediminitomix flava]PWJ43932.1 alkylation response protein AidB-like acyl-CoA dehydrogenase [Sediminitomix flava]